MNPTRFTYSRHMGAPRGRRGAEARRHRARVAALAVHRRALADAHRRFLASPEGRQWSDR